MGNLRKRVFGLCLILAAPAASLCAGTLPQTGFPTDPVHLFATCTGRLSALMEFQWLVQDPGSAATETRRDAMAELLQAALSDGGNATAMELRLEAKFAEAQLLQKALNRDGGWALTLAKRQVDDCTALLLS